MKIHAWGALLLGASVGAWAAGPGDFRLEVDTPRPDGSEDTALHGYVLLQPGASESRAVGTVGRAYSLSSRPGNTVWGVVTEAINFPVARGNVIGTESAVVNTAPGNVGELRGLDVVFKDRLDANADDPVPTVGDNRFNESSAALYISSQPRSPAGEYSGWQAGIRFAPSSVDRSASRPYAVAIDLSEVRVEAPFYFVVWSCGGVRCGLRLTDAGAILVTDVDRAP